MCRLLLLIAALTLVLPSVSAEDVCFSTRAAPTTPYGLDLCHIYAKNACCLPSYDQTIKSAYQSIVPYGPGCTPGSQMVFAMLYDIMLYLCLPCNPEEPSFRLESARGDMVDGGVVPPAIGAAPGEYTWRVCRSFLYGPKGSNRGLWGDKASQYDTCGLHLQSCQATPIFDINTSTFLDPPSTCSSELQLTIPSVAFAGSADPGLEMLSLVAQTNPYFQMVVVDDESDAYSFDKTPCFGRRTRDSAQSPSSSSELASTVILLISLLLIA